MVVGNAVKHVIKSQVFLVIFQSIFFCLVASFHALHARFVGPTESTEYRKNRERTPPVVRASGVGSARSVLEVNGNNAL